MKIVIIISINGLILNFKARIWEYYTLRKSLQNKEGLHTIWNKGDLDWGFGLYKAIYYKAPLFQTVWGLSL